MAVMGGSLQADQLELHGYDRIDAIVDETVGEGGAGLGFTVHDEDDVGHFGERRDPVVQALGVGVDGQ